MTGAALAPASGRRPATSRCRQRGTRPAGRRQSSAATARLQRARASRLSLLSESGVRHRRSKPDPSSANRQRAVARKSGSGPEEACARREDRERRRHIAEPQVEAQRVGIDSRGNAASASSAFSSDANAARRVPSSTAASCRTGRAQARAAAAAVPNREREHAGKPMHAIDPPRGRKRQESPRCRSAIEAWPSPSSSRGARESCKSRR